MNVLTLGTFDLFHAGHVNLLRVCRALAGEGLVAVGLNTDDFVQRYKQRAPVVDFERRRSVLLACRFVDHVLANDQPDGSAAGLISTSYSDAIVVGSDWRDRDYPAQLGVTWDWLRAQCIEVVFVPYTSGISSTAIRERLT